VVLLSVTFDLSLLLLSCFPLVISVAFLGFFSLFLSVFLLSVLLFSLLLLCGSGCVLLCGILLFLFCWFYSPVTLALKFSLNFNLIIMRDLMIKT